MYILQCHQEDDINLTIGQLGDACGPYILRNDPYPPFAPRVGYKDGNEYWHDSWSHRYVGHVSVPLLKVAANDELRCLVNLHEISIIVLRI